MTKVVLHYDEGNYLVSYNDTPDSYLGKLTYVQLYYNILL